MPAEVVLAVSLHILCRLFGNVEHFALLHELLGLFERIRERFRDGRATAIEEVFVHVTAKILSGRFGVSRNIFGAYRILGRIAVSQLNARVLRTEIGRVVAAPTTTAGRYKNVAGERR